MMPIIGDVKMILPQIPLSRRSLKVYNGPPLNGALARMLRRSYGHPLRPSPKVKALCATLPLAQGHEDDTDRHIQRGAARGAARSTAHSHAPRA